MNVYESTFVLGSLDRWHEMSSGATLLIALPTHDGQLTVIALWQMTSSYLRRGPQV